MPHIIVHIYIYLRIFTFIIYSLIYSLFHYKYKIYNQEISVRLHHTTSPWVLQIRHICFIFNTHTITHTIILNMHASPWQSKLISYTNQQPEWYCLTKFGEKP